MKIRPVARSGHTRSGRARNRRKKKYIDVPRRSRVPVYAAGAILLTMLAASLWGVAVIDCNSSQVGWNRRPTEFAVALTPGWDRLSLTLFGRQGSIPLGPAGRVRELPALIGKASGYGQPAPLREGRLLLGLCYRRSDFVREAFETLHESG